MDSETQQKRTVLKVELEIQKAQEVTDTTTRFKQLTIAQVQVREAKHMYMKQGMSQRDWNQLLRDECKKIAEECPEMAKGALRMVKKMENLDPMLRLHIGRSSTSIGASSSSEATTAVPSRGSSVGASWHLCPDA